MNKKLVSLLFVSSFVLGACGGNITDTENQKETSSSLEVVSESIKIEKEIEEEPEEKPEELALKAAETYSSTMKMSKQGIYDQLISKVGEGFSEEEAQYAIDNIDANWKENALKKAEMYTDEMDISDSKVYDKLISSAGEKFTKEEAQYAIDNLE